MEPDWIGKFLAESTVDQHRALGRMALEKGFITREQLDGALAEQEAAMAEGRHQFVGQILLNRGHLRTAQLQELLAGQGPVDMPSTLGRYVLRRRLGQGGMGVVYEAEDPDLRRRVAIKVLRDDDADAGVVMRLHREAAIAAQLQHPNIVPVHEISSVRRPDGRMIHFIVMDFIDGRTFAEAVAADLPRGDILRMIEDLARALQYAHDRGVVHRDVKPANVMIDKTGRVLLMDFGLAHADIFNTRLTRSREAIGTPAFMAPEQVRGDLRAIGPRTDVYALGVMLYQALAGRLPFDGRTLPEVFSQILNDEPPPPGHGRRDVARDLDVICMKAMEKDVARRYAGAAALADDLARFRQGERILARPPSAVQAISRRLRRHAVLAGAVATLLVASFAAAVALTIQRNRSLHRQAQLTRLATLWTSAVQRNEDLRRERVSVEHARDGLAASLASLDAFVGENPDLPEGFYVRARCRFYAGRYDDALADVARALALVPGFAAARRLRALVRVERVQTLYRSYDEERAESTRLAHELLAGIADDLREGPADLEAAAEDEVLRACAQALALRYGGKPEAAVALLERAVAVRRAEEYAVLLGVLTRDAAWLQKAVEWAPGFFWARVERAYASMDSGRFDDAAAEFTQALNLRPDSANVLCERGTANLHAGRPEAAIRDFTDALRLKRDHLHALLNRGRARKTTDPDAAIRDYTEAIRIDPRFAKAYVNRASVLYARGDPDAAMRDLAEALRIEPNNATAYANRASIRQRSGDLDGALADAQQSLASRPGYPFGLLARGFAHLGFDRVDEAVADFDAAIAGNARLSSAFYGRAMARQKRGDLDDAIRDYDESIRLEPGVAERYMRRASARLIRNELAAAVVDCDEAIRLDPALARAYTVRCLARVGLRQLEGARRDGDEAVRLAPADVDARVNRGLARDASGDGRGALADFDEAVRLDPRDPLALVNRGRLRQKLGDAAGARADYDAALSFAPADWHLRAEVQRLRDRIQQ